MGLFDMLANGLKNGVNSQTGGNYRKIYFDRNPGRTHSCKNCGKTLSVGDSNLHIDHIIPKSLGGTNAVTNLQVLCGSCNTRKGNRINVLREAGHSAQAIVRELKNGF